MSTTPRTGGKSSFIWNFYDVDSYEKARCLICQRIYSRKGCCTSGLITHLKKKHTDTFLLYLNKGVVRLDGFEESANTIKHEPDENSLEAKMRLKRKRSADNSDEGGAEAGAAAAADESAADFPGFADDAPLADDEPADVLRDFHETPEEPQHKAKPIEQMLLDEDEYPLLSVPGRVRRENPLPTSSFNNSNKGSTEIESLLKKQLAIQAKLYKDIKEKMEQISTSLKENERISKKRYRLKAEKIRLLKEEMKQKELHRKEMHRLRLLELDILNKKNIQEQQHYNHQI